MPVFVKKSLLEFMNTFNVNPALNEAALINLFLVVQIDKCGFTKKQLTALRYTIMYFATEIVSFTR
jgi:hypothetical protein